MKSFTATTFAADHAEALAHAEALVRDDPQALFTDFQWFLYRARNTVYFTAFSQERLDHDHLIKLVGEMVSLAPQLTHGFKGARPGQPFPLAMLEAVTSSIEVDEFDGYPDKWLEPGLEVFEDDELPLFRVRAIVRRDGPDAEGRASMLLVRSSHALMEGADSALLTRSHSAGHGVMSSSANKVPWGRKFGYAALAALSAPMHLAAAHLMSPGRKEMGFRSLVLERQKLRRVANALGVRQRALMFGLVMHALNKGGEGLHRKAIKTVYTMLDDDRRDADDDFFRVRSLEAKFPVEGDLVSFIRTVDRTISAVEQKDLTRTQFVLNAMFAMHRRLARVFPYLYSERFFRFNGGYHLVLTLVPPHRMYGSLTHGMMEPVFCGSYHPGSNLCTYVPARDHITFNFCTRTRHLPDADRVHALLDQLDSETTGNDR